MIAELPSIKVMYVVSQKGVSGAQSAFNVLESKLPTLKGRKFYGAVFGIPPNEEYWACIELASGDVPETWGFKTGTIPGGKYEQERINNWNDNMNLIGEAFERLSKDNTVDRSRPQIEFYRSMRDMLVRVPIK